MLSATSGGKILKESERAAELFDTLAGRTWDYVTDSHSLRLSISEETITDMNLLEIRRANLSNVGIAKFPKHREALVGADWDLWIGADAVGWLRYLVQAKKICLPSLKYYRLRHLCRDQYKGKAFQIDQLQRFAMQEKAIPIYCFYNGGDQLLSKHPSLGDHASRIDKTYGCTVSSYRVVRECHDSRRQGSKDFSSLHRRDESFPWSALIRKHLTWVHAFSRYRNHPLVDRPGASSSFNAKVFRYLPGTIRSMVNLFPVTEDRVYDRIPQSRQQIDEPHTELLSYISDIVTADDIEAKVTRAEYPGLIPNRIGVVDIGPDLQQSLALSRLMDRT